MRIGVADYGMNVWEGGACFDWEDRLAQLLRIGYAGIERLTAANGEHALQAAARARRLGADFATVRAATQELSIQYTAALGKAYVWTHAEAKDFDAFCRQVRHQADVCERWGVRVALHNHMGTPVEKQAELESFLEACPSCLLILDTAHLAAMRGDPVEIAATYADRLAALHLKDWLEVEPDSPQWTKRVRFCELGAGLLGRANADALREAVKRGFDGWAFVEQDAHSRSPLLDLKASRQFLRRETGY